MATNFCPNRITVPVFNQAIVFALHYKYIVTKSFHYFEGLRPPTVIVSAS